MITLGATSRHGLCYGFSRAVLPLLGQSGNLFKLLFLKLAQVSNLSLHFAGRSVDHSLVFFRDVFIGFLGLFVGKAAH